MQQVLHYGNYFLKIFNNLRYEICMGTDGITHML